MTLLAFLCALAAGFAWWTITGTSVVIAGGMTIYNAAMGLVAATACGFAINRAARDGDFKPAISGALLLALIVFGFHVAWRYGPPGMLHGWAYALVGACFLGLGTRRYQHAIGGVLTAMSIASFANVLGAFPSRPRVFTGLYYPDLIAYGMHSAFIIIGASADDGLRVWASRLDWPSGRLRHPVGVRGTDRNDAEKVAE